MYRHWDEHKYNFKVYTPPYNINKRHYKKMSIKSLGHLPTSYNDYLANTGTEASINVKINSSGGTLIISGTSVYHVFTGGGNLEVITGPITADILIVASIS